MESPPLKIASCKIEHHHHYSQPVEDDEDFNDIEVVITNNVNHKTTSFTLPLEDPTLVNPENIYEFVWDTAMEDLDDLDVDPSFRPTIIDEIASACLTVCTNNIDHPTIVLHLEKVNPKEVIANLLVESGVSVNKTASCVNSWFPCSCAICLEEAVSCYDNSTTGGDEADRMVAKLKCSHVYHLDCVVDWVIKCGSRDNATFSCPLCRSSLFEYANAASLLVKSLIGIN